jgi:hypothetical protein
MNRRNLIFAFLLTTICGTVLAAPKVYKYKCTKCHLIQEYSVPGTKKCPNDGRIMIRQN